VIACNTAHYFYDDVVKHTKVKIIHMIEETAKFLNKTYPDSKEFLLLSTKGTYKSEIYQKAFKKNGLKVLEPSLSDKDVIMDWIYKIKASNFHISRGEYKSLVLKYIEFGDAPVILGCTELSLLPNLIHLRKEQYVNPTLVLAQYCVELAKKEKARS
ncbi:MAG TPA: amino acid racemase, partial [Tissierellaceae bacterium]|nr:amino acid racemase [Tissierellaceae bacterium]